MITLSEPVDIATPNGAWRTYVGLFGDGQRVFMCGAPADRKPKGKPLLRVQYGCAHGTIFRSLDCDCNAQIQASQDAIAAAPESGLFVYFQDHEAYGLGIFEKMQIINRERRENKHFDEIASDPHYRQLRNNVLWAVPHLLDELQLGRSVQLISDNHEKRRALEDVGVDTARAVPLCVSDAGLTAEARRHREGLKIAS